jgi:hypothetical protein
MKNWIPNGGRKIGRPKIGGSIRSSRNKLQSLTQEKKKNLHLATTSHITNFPHKIFA